MAEPHRPWLEPLPDEVSPSDVDADDELDEQDEDGEEGGDGGDAVVLDMNLSRRLMEKKYSGDAF